MNLLIIGYCHLDDGFLYASKALESKYKIFFFPYLSYIMDNIENKDEILVSYILNNNINICLWWNNSVKFENYNNIFAKLDNYKTINVFFNWDPFLYNYQKYNALCWKERIDEKINYYPLMNIVLSCFETEINYFKNKLNILYAPPGFDKDISNYDYDEEYICDVSIICTNTYNNTNEFPEDATNITRYSVVDKLYEHRNKINFHIYGTENLKNAYPDCYKGFIKYKDCYKVFSNSKINLSIHPIVKELNNENSNAEYFSERVPQILGCKGLLVTNSLFTDKLAKDSDYIFIDDENWYDKIIHIIKNSETYDNIRENGYQKALTNYTWSNWANILISSLENI
jgi:hypothetical protein